MVAMAWVNSCPNTYIQIGLGRYKYNRDMHVIPAISGISIRPLKSVMNTSSQNNLPIAKQNGSKTIANTNLNLLNNSNILTQTAIISRLKTNELELISSRCDHMMTE
ncbi:MAG: hypothetical protein CMO79_05275 [Verrucomicrobiales bacterium]|nr:hypothetical protein [Verrucomicrobiales bacterium]